MQCQWVSLFLLALVYMVHAVPALQYKLLSERCGLFLKVHSNGQVTADASRVDASSFTITSAPNGKFRFASSGQYLAISDSGTITTLTTTSSENTDFTHVSVSTSGLNSFALKLQRNGVDCFIGFQVNGQPISNPCAGLDSSSVETHLQLVPC